MGKTTDLSKSGNPKIHLDDQDQRLLTTTPTYLEGPDTKRRGVVININNYLSPGRQTKQSVRRVLQILIVVAFVNLVAVYLGWIVIPGFKKQLISSKFVLSPEVNPQLYTAWKAFPLPIYMPVYLFNVTNPEQVRTGKLPKLQEVGPYVFVERRNKIDVTQDEREDTVSYKQYTTFQFDKTLTGNLTLDDTIVTVNVPFLGAAIKIAEEVSWLLGDLAHSVLSGYKEPLFLQKTAGELLFQGYKVPFLEKLEQDVGLAMIPNNMFGYFVDLNASTVGPFTIFRGIQDSSKIGSVLKFRNEPTLNIWGGGRDSPCNKIEGSDGTVYPTFVTRQTVLRFFGVELCRSLYATYQKDDIFRGITGYRFTLPPSILGDPRIYPENSCYCLDMPTNPKKCMKQGVMDMAPCRDGAPMTISYPHFFEADSDYVNKSGLTPNRGRHETFILIEPMTGVILRGIRRLQVNLRMKPIKSLTLLKKLPEMMLPLMWMEQSAELDEGYAETVRMIVALDWWSELLCKGTVLLAAFLFSWWIIRKQHRFSQDGQISSN